MSNNFPPILFFITQIRKINLTPSSQIGNVNKKKKKKKFTKIVSILSGQSFKKKIFKFLIFRQIFQGLGPVQRNSRLFNGI